MEQLTKIKTITNITGNEQDTFINSYIDLVKTQLYELGISNKYLNSIEAAGIIAKAITDLIEVGDFMKTTLMLIATLRANHPHSEDKAVSYV